MTQRQLAVLALRLMGIYALIQSVVRGDFFYILFPIFATGGSAVSQLLFVIVFVGIQLAVGLGIGLTLILGADKLSRWILPEFGDAPFSAATDSRTIQGIAFSCIGVLLLARGLTAVFSGVGSLVMYSETNSALGRGARGTSIWGLATGLLSVAFGLGLFFGGRALARYWHRLRDAATPRASTEQDSTPDPTQTKDA